MTFSTKLAGGTPQLPALDDYASAVPQAAPQQQTSPRETPYHSDDDARALANSIPQLAWIAGQDGRISWYNERWYAYTGTTPAQMREGGWPLVLAPDCLAPLEQRWRQSLASAEPFELECPIRGADGQFRWFLTRANPVRDSAGQVLRWFGTSTDVDQVKRVQEALRDETAILELLNHTGSALASTRDLQPLLQQVTDAATGISGARYGALVYYGGADDTRAMPPTLAAGTPACFVDFGLARAAKQGQGQDIERSADLPQQAAMTAPLRSYLAVPVRARSGAVLGSLLLGHPEPAMFSERTERIIGGVAAQAAVAIDNARLYEAAQQAAEERKVLLDSERSARAEAERTSQMKDEFLSTMSHELRTPLTAILGWAQVLRHRIRDQADLQHGLHVIERNARSQAQLIEDLLDMGRITSGKVKLEMAALSPAAIAAAAIDTVRPAAHAKDIRIEQHFDAAPGMVAGDAGRLQQIIWNLLSNALKFTPRGGTVQVGVRRAGDQIEIDVRDNGIGIAPDFLAHVFERFRQADSSSSRKHGGLGLGLSIVRHLVEQHGGSVSAASDGEDRGACFTVRLPRISALLPRPGATPRAVAAPAPASRAQHDLSGLKVLVVDDEDDARELIQRILSDCNADVLTAATAAEALALLQQTRPDLMVSDLGMPDVDGFGLLDRVRALGPGRGGDLPAIALTAYARSEDRIKALSSGFLAHIAKPVDPAELIAKVGAMGAAHRHA